MAALDPTEEIEEEEGKPPCRPRSTLKLIKQTTPDNDLDDSDDEGDDYMRDLLLGGEDDSDESDEDEEDEANGGPSDPSKSRKARQAAALKELLEATKDDGSDEEMADDEPKGKKANGVAKGKGKAKATQVDEEDSEEEESDDDDAESDEGLDLEQFVLCTLDTDAVSGHCSPADNH